MKITNKKGLPDALVKAIQNDGYDAGDSDYTISTLLSPPRIQVLKTLHAHEMEEDVEDGLYRLYGQIAHGIIERSNTNDLAEKRYFATIDGKKISAQIDTLARSNGILSDFKFTSAWAFKQGEPKPEWIAQLNVQLELLRQNGEDATAIQIVGLIRDYNLREAKQYPDSYPQSLVVTMPLPMWSREQTMAFIRMRIAVHEAAKKELPQCTTDERWAKPDQYAVVKGKRAIPGGVQFSLETAEELCRKNPGTRVELRPGTSTRCESYCSVSKFCVQYQQTMESNSAGAEEKINAVS